jgi:hypothetical protein
MVNYIHQTRVIPGGHYFLEVGYNLGVLWVLVEVLSVHHKGTVEVRLVAGDNTSFLVTVCNLFRRITADMGITKEEASRL